MELKGVDDPATKLSVEVRARSAPLSPEVARCLHLHMHPASPPPLAAAAAAAARCRVNLSFPCFVAARR